MKSNRFLVGIAVSCYFLYAIMQLSLFNSLTIYLIQYLHFTRIKVGILSSTYLYALALSLVPAGYLLDKYQTRKCLLIALFFSTASTLALAISHNTPVLTIYRIISGISNGFAFLGGLRVAQYWFREKSALASGIIISAGMSGGFFASIFFPHLAASFGWNATFLVNFMLGLTILLLSLLFLKNHDNENDEIMRSTTSFKSVINAVKNVQNWLCGTYTGLLNLSVYLLATLWGSLYLMNRYHMTNASATFITGMIFIGIIIGSPFWGWLSDRLHNRKHSMLIGSTLSALVVACILLTNFSSELTLPILFLSLGIATSSQVISYPTIAESNPIGLVSTATSFAALIINIIGAVSQPVFGWLLTSKSNVTNSHMLSVISNNGQNTAMLFLLLAFLLAIVTALFIRDKAHIQKSCNALL